MKRQRVRMMRPNDEAGVRQWAADATITLGVPITLPNVLMGPGRVTAIVEDEDGRIILALVGQLFLSLDPLVKNPAALPTEVLRALELGARALEFHAQVEGAVATAVCIPAGLPDYHDLLTRFGYVNLTEGCRVLAMSLEGGPIPSPFEALPPPLRRRVEV